VEKEIELAEYTLPLFSASLSVPQQLPFSMGKIPITISAQYTFGEPVNGIANLKIEKMNDLVYERNVTVTSESTTIDLSIDDDLRAASKTFNSYQAILTFNDPLTSKTVVDVQQFTITPFAFSIILTGNSPYVQPGEFYDFSVSVRNYDGSPAKAGTIVNIFIQPLNENQTLTLDENGSVDSSIFIPDGTPYIHIHATYPDSSDGHLDAYQPWSGDGSFIRIDVLTQK
jgi:hypothetical protein